MDGNTTYPAKSSVIDENLFKKLIKEYQPRNDIIEVRPKKGWVLPNRVKFPQWIQETFSYKKFMQGADVLFPSQRFVKDYIQYDSPYRGVLLYHGLGLGKTKASIIAGETLVDHYEKIIIMIPASLKVNYIEELKNKGSNSFFTIHQNWFFIPKELFQTEAKKQKKGIKDMVNEVATQLFVDYSIVQKQRGIWVPLEGDSNWDTLPQTDKSMVNSQLDNMIKNKYEFIQYNGITRAKTNQLEKELQSGFNRYDNKVIIIDEVHNFVSRSLKPTSLGKSFFNAIYKAKNTKLILLTGTPLINYPYEMSYIINLLKGPQIVYTIKPRKFDKNAIDTIMRANPHVDHYNILYDQEQVEFQLLPYGFQYIDHPQRMVKRVEPIVPSSNSQQSNNNTNVIKAHTNKVVADILTALKARKIHEEDYKILPMNKEAFNERYINMATNSIKNPLVLKRRMMGCISYFGTYFGELYPSLKPTNIVNVKMSDHQFKTYLAKRSEEIKAEERNRLQKKRKKNNDDDVFGQKTQTYRSFTRAICDFVFPTEISRPYPTSKKEMLEELDITGELPEDVENELGMSDIPLTQEPAEQQGGAVDTKKYQRALTTAMNALNRRAHLMLTGELLKQHSPKYFEVMKKVNDQSLKGKILVYSQFRQIEGLGVLGIVLKAHGWVEFKLVKSTGGEWQVDFQGKSEEEWKKAPKFFQFYTGQDDTKILMKIYNNDFGDCPQSISRHFSMKENKRGEILRLMMITQSGAEGISLKHVRHVHVIEPYWNEIRIDQVIGRAVRANSHVDLPESERNVSVYRYIIQLTDKQKQEETMRKDDGLTTDEFIYNIAFRKASIINGLQDLMKEAAVDCMVHDHSHKASCLTFPRNIDQNGMSYVWDDSLEESDDVLNQRKKITKEKVSGHFRSCKIDGIKYAVNMTTKNIYDFDSYKNGMLVKRGYFTQTADGRLKIEWIS
jgi:hypothetical protein